MSFDNENDETKIEFDAKNGGSSSGNSGDKNSKSGKASARGGR